MIKFLFPCFSDSLREVEPQFRYEYNIVKLLGFEAYLFDHDTLVTSTEMHDPTIRTNMKDFSVESEIIYRGWMLKKTEYDSLYKCFSKRNQYLINLPILYNLCHYYPNIHDTIRKFTPNVRWFDMSNNTSVSNSDLIDMYNFIINTNSGVILKDYVKSEKNIPDLFRIHKSTDLVALKDKINNFITTRGSCFNVGIVLKEFINIKRYCEIPNEWRIFYFKGKILSMSPNSHHIVDDFVGKKPDVDWLNNIAVDISSQYFSIDVAEGLDSKWFVVEVGDGQVSGLSPNQSVLKYYARLRDMSCGIIKKVKKEHYTCY